MTLTEYMARLDLPEKEMARRLGVSVSALSKWKRGVRIPRPRAMVRIRDATTGLVAPEDFMPSRQITDFLPLRARKVAAE
jgi:transcriptional regulator with XRE-family HTH domain